MGSWISACLCIIITLFLTEGKAQIILGSGPNHYLKGIDAITYDAYFESEMTGPRCAIKKDNWTIAADFVVNQSARLKLINDKEYHAHHDELVRVRDSLLAKSIANNYQGMEEFDAAQKELLDYAHIPRLTISVTPIELESGCAGVLEGKLVVDVAPTQIIATKVEVFPSNRSDLDL